MSVNGFAFPPPPPPPPRGSYDDNRDSCWERPRGGGPSRGGFSSRGNRGFGRGNYRSSDTNAPFNRPRHSVSDLSPPHKRDHATAFSNTRPQAPAAVPSFNASIENLLAPKVTASLPRKQQEKRANLLGLTPSTAEASDSEDDRDEESCLAEVSTTTDLQFEYKGHTSMLRTQVEIAAWLAERKKKWPTEARREAAKKEDEEKRRKWQEEKQKKVEAFQAAKQNRLEQRWTGTSTKKGSKTTRTSLPAAGSTPDLGNAAQLRTEHLRRKAAKAQRELEKAESKLLKSAPSVPQVDSGYTGLEDADLADSDDDTSSLSDSSHLTGSGSDTSSASDSDDSGPEELSSKIEVAKLSSSLERRVRKKQPCQFFAKHGSCRYGTRCKYAHDPGPAQTRISTPNSQKVRKGLWQMMMEKEREEENKKVLSAIIALGKQGVLDDDPET